MLPKRKNIQFQFCATLSILRLVFYNSLKHIFSVIGFSSLQDYTVNILTCTEGGQICSIILVSLVNV